MGDKPKISCLLLKVHINNIAQSNCLQPAVKKNKIEDIPPLL